ncbi:MAG: acyl--CoA ligase [Bacteroidales bacterium]|nr:acyl--CoA ligase [Bacteroidales bacterium]
MSPAADAPEQSLSVVHADPLDEQGPTLTIPAFLRQVVDRWSDREAVVADTGTLRWSYRDLWHSSLDIAAALSARGVGKGSRVGVLMTNSPEFIASVFGIAMAGGVVVAFNTFATPHELDALIKAADIEILLFEQQIARRDFARVLVELEPGIGEAEPGGLVSQRFPFLRLAVVITREGQSLCGGLLDWSDFLRGGEQIPRALIDARMASLSPADTAILFFSSGSTGVPKGILHNQRAVALQWRSWPAAMGFDGVLRVWTANGFFWSGNFAMAIGSALSTGGTLVLQSIFDAPKALELMGRERVNTPLAMPHQWGRIAEVPGFRDMDLSHLHYLDGTFWGLDNPTLPTTFRQPQAFGCTETLTINTTTCFDEAGKTRREGHGLPMQGNTLKIVDPLSGATLPRGERGEIAVKGPTLMMGYLGKTPDQCFDDEGFFHTGDGGFVDDSGWLFWEGRLTDIIKTGGANVSPQEVDEVIVTHPAVKATQTVGLPHDNLGEMVVSCLVLHEGMDIEPEAFRHFLKERLASYKVPREILVLGDEELALTASGNKIKAAAVREIAAARLAMQTEAR